MSAGVSAHESAVGRDTQIIKRTGPGTKGTVGDQTRQKNERHYEYLTNTLTLLVFSMTCVVQGELSLSSDMEMLQMALFYDSVPESWSRLAYPSTKTLGPWYSILQSS